MNKLNFVYTVEETGDSFKTDKPLEEGCMYTTDYFTGDRYLFKDGKLELIHIGHNAEFVPGLQLFKL